METTRRKNGTSVSFSASMARQADLKPDRTRLLNGLNQNGGDAY
jgi:hypothetical protein